MAAKWQRVGRWAMEPELSRFIRYWRKKGYVVKKVKEQTPPFGDPKLKGKGYRVYIRPKK